MCRKANIFDFALVTSSAEIGIYFVSFIAFLIYYLSLNLTLPTGIDSYETASAEAPFIAFLVIIFLIVIFTGLEIFGIIERNKCLIIVSLILRVVRFLVMDLGSIIVM